MDHRLRQILELALRPETGEGESEAALAAARRLVAKHGTELLGASAPERVVYRDKVVYHKPHHAYSFTMTLTIPTAYHHTMMERIFLDAEALGCDIRLISCKTKTRTLVSGTVIKFQVLGEKPQVHKYESWIDSYIDEINNRKHKAQSQTHNFSTAHDTPHTADKPKSWFRKWFGG